MHLANQSVRKIEAILHQIEDLLRSDFPNTAGEDALKLFRDFFGAQKDRINKSRSNPKTLNRAAITANQRIREFLPVLGFILRSTNVRNSFEYYQPFLEMARRLIGANAQVILSSEWDYSPLTYPLTVSVLPNYVLIGMPSFESFNALIFPLAGHELGHSLWQTEGLERSYSATVEKISRDRLRATWSEFSLRFPGHQPLAPSDDEIDRNVFFSDIVAEISDYSLGQIEEIFCDAVGASIFGMSYLHAFRYLLAPSSGGERSLFYPRLRTRAQLLEQFGGVNLSKEGLGEYSQEFEDKQPNLSSQASYTSEIADELGRSEARELFLKAAQIVTSRIPNMLPDSAKTEKIYSMFSKNLPCADPSSLTDILNAGWMYILANDKVMDESNRLIFEWTSELVLKTLEVLEVDRRLHA